VSWVDHVTWWQIYPLGFLGAEELGPFQSEVYQGCKGGSII
jgi:hypothetical protein